CWCRLPTCPARPPPRSPLFPYPTFFRSAISAALRPAFSHAFTYVSRLFASCSTLPRKSEFSIGTPRRAVASIVSGLVHTTYTGRSDEHTSELQSPAHLGCRLLPANKKHA